MKLIVTVRYYDALIDGGDGHPIHVVKTVEAGTLIGCLKKAIDEVNAETPKAHGNAMWAGYDIPRQT